MKTIAHQPNPGRNLQVDIPPPLKQELKVIAALTGRDLRDVVVEKLERGLSDFKKELLDAQGSNGAVEKPTSNGSSTRRKK